MKKYLFLAMLLMVGVVGVNAQEDNEDPDVKYAANLLKPGTVAPEFVVDFKDTTENTPLSSFRGRYVVLDFWASWCPDCRRDIAKVKELHDEYSLYDVAFIGISFDTNRDAWENCIRKNNMNWLHYSELKKWKKESKIDRDYHIDWIPTYYIIDPDGKVLLGTVVLDKVENELRKLSENGLIDKRENEDGKCWATPDAPEFPGGEVARQKFVADNLKYPDIAIQYGAEGKVIMMLEVDENGNCGNFKAVDCTISNYNRAKFDKLTTSKQEELKKAISLAFAKEAYKVLKKMPVWKPGMLNGKPVRIKLRQTFRYNLK
jgi:peroxiredoxin